MGELLLDMELPLPLPVDLCPDSSARMFPDKSAEMFPDSSARLFPDKYRDRNAKMYPDSSAEMFPDKSARTCLDNSVNRFQDSSAQPPSLPMENKSSLTFHSSYHEYLQQKYVYLHSLSNFVLIYFFYSQNIVHHCATKKLISSYIYLFNFCSPN